MHPANSAVEVLSSVGGFPVQFLDKDPGLGVAFSASDDVMDESAVHESEVAGLKAVADDP